MFMVMHLIYEPRELSNFYTLNKAFNYTKAVQVQQLLYHDLIKN